MTDERNTGPAGWSVIRDGKVVYDGSERGAREVYERQVRDFPEAGIKLYSPPKAKLSPSDAARQRLDRARDEVLEAVRDHSQDRLIPAIEALVEAKVLFAYLEDGGLIDRLRRQRAALEAVDGCIPPSDRAILERPDGAAYVRIPLSATAYRELRAALRAAPDDR